MSRVDIGFCLGDRSVRVAANLRTQKASAVAAIRDALRQADGNSDRADRITRIPVRPQNITGTA